MTHTPLKTAFDRLNTAIGRLDAATAEAGIRQSAAAFSQVQVTAELTAEWEAKVAANESELLSTREENDFLKSDNLRLGNQLQELQQEHLELQRAAGSIVQRLDGSIRQLDVMLEH